MNLARMTKHLQDIYDEFETAVACHKQAAVCRAGCAFCCTTVGDVDITTLEGIIIRNHLSSLPKKIRLRLEKAVAENRREKERQSIVPCPFLAGDRTCSIYAVRPFSCRRLYSVKPCGETGPTLHREAAALSDAAVTALQQLDDTGYSGHISHILHLLDMPRFRKHYLSGGFDPADIMDFGKAHRIVINRFAAARKPDMQPHPAISQQPVVLP
ncbi:YkgJ family cysteine cluster protein [Desulfococcus sp.]|uniref:YkgJ family cysteine cluster protein n=1 Tax=Desulfococcus sp. TaxID=2025834 RepID=UPI003593E1B3